MKRRTKKEESDMGRDVENIMAPKSFNTYRMSVLKSV